MTIKIKENTERHPTNIHRKELDDGGLQLLKELDEDKKIGYSFDDDDKLQITTKDYVGSFQIPGTNHRIDIHPKILEDEGWKNLSRFLSFAEHGTLDYFEGEHIAKFGDDDHLIDTLHDKLIKTYEELERQGLLKSYVVHEENTSSMRGKLLIRQQMGNDAMLRPKFFCEFDELEYDSQENRVILQALTIVARTSEIDVRRMEAMMHAQKLSGVVQKAEVSAPVRERMMHSYNRQTFRYEEIHGICDKVIRESGIEDLYGGEVTSVRPKLYDMDKEFERFLENLIKKYQSSWNVKVQSEGEEVSWEGGIFSDRKMKPDITIWDEEWQECTHIIDAKYKTGQIAAADLYQLGFYMHEYVKLPQKMENSFIIAPESDGKKTTQKYTASKSKKEIYVKRLNVEKCLKLFEEQDVKKLSKLVEWFIDPSTEPFDYAT